MPLFYLDASALVKLVREEPETPALRAYLSGADLVSTELVLTELPRALRRAAHNDPQVPVEALIGTAAEGGASESPQRVILQLQRTRTSPG